MGGCGCGCAGVGGCVGVYGCVGEGVGGWVCGFVCGWVCGWVYLCGCVRAWSISNFRKASMWIAILNSRKCAFADSFPVSDNVFSRMIMGRRLSTRCIDSTRGQDLAIERACDGCASLLLTNSGPSTSPAKLVELHSGRIDDNQPSSNSNYRWKEASDDEVMTAFSAADVAEFDTNQFTMFLADLNESTPISATVCAALFYNTTPIALRPLTSLSLPTLMFSKLLFHHLYI